MNFKNVVGSLILVLFSSSLAYANPTQRCDNANAIEFFAPLAQLVISNAGTPPVERLCIHLDKARIYNKIDGNESEVIRQLNIFIRITNNQTPENFSQAASDAFIAEAERLIVLLGGNPVPPGELPPHPGAAGKATLEGIDSDNDGIRDDLQIFIAETWPDSERMQEMMTMGVKNWQNQLVMAHDKALARANVDGMGPSQHLYLCYGYIDWKYGVNGYDELIDVLTPQVLNTWERRDRDILFGKQLSGLATDHGRHIPSKKGEPYCDFDPDILPN